MAEFRDEKKKYYTAVESSDFNHGVFSKKALMAAVNRKNGGSKLFKPGDVIKTMGSDTHE